MIDNKLQAKSRLLIIPVALLVLILGILTVIFYHPNLFALAGLSLGILCLLLAFVVFAYSTQEIHRLWALFNIVVGVWGMGTFFVGVSKTYAQALLGWKFSYSGGILIAVLFHHVVCSFCKLNRKNLIIFSYIQGLFFVLINLFTPLFTGHLEFLFNSFYYNKATVVYTIWFLIWSYFVFLAFFELFKFIQRTRGNQQTQALYLFWGMLLGFLGGTSTVAPSFGILVYPGWHFTICIYAGIMTYAMFRYQIMDISIAVTRVGIFAVVYSLVLGIPFGLAILGKSWLIKKMGENWFWIPMIVLLLLATAGPFLLIYLQRRAEDRILEDEKRIQDILKKTSNGLTTIRNLRQLLSLIQGVLIKSLKVDYIAIYLLESEINSYILKTSYPSKEHVENVPEDNYLITFLKEKKYPIVCEEIKFLSAGIKKENIEAVQISSSMQILSAAVAIPIMGEKQLLGLILLGERPEKLIYSPELISALSVVGSGVALSLEIIMSMAERDKLLIENFRKSRFESLALLCTSVSHQIDNRFQGIFYSLQDPLGVFNNSNYKDYSKEDFIALLEDFAISAKESIAIAKDGSTVTRGILNFSKGKVEFGLVNFDSIVDTSLNFVQLKRANQKIEIRKEYPKDTILWASQAILNDILANAIDNSWFAMNLKKNHFNDPNYIPLIIIRGYTNTSMFHFEIEDNGMGIKKEDIHKVFDPMFSTKGTLQGTGMGTTVMLQFIHQHDGSIAYESEYEKWTKVKIILPLATEEQKGTVRNV